MQEQQIPTVLLEWQSLEAYPHERSVRWYLTGGILLLGFAAYGLFSNSWSTALLALAIGGIYFLLRNNPPRGITVRITGLGVQVGNQFTPWHQLRTFWIIETSAGVYPPSGLRALQGLNGERSRGAPTPVHMELHLTPTRFLQPELVVFLDATDPVKVRETLMKFLPERAGMEERMLDSLARFLKL